jgi:hypothetical protein
MPGFNYPRHPIFRIAPVLARGVQADPYVHVLAAKIRHGKYCSDLWDCNGLYLDYQQRLDPRADRPMNLQTTAFKSRYIMTPEQLKAWRNSPEVLAAQAAEKERRAKAAEEKAERMRFAAEERAARKRRQEEQERREREWNDAEAALNADLEAEEKRERATILAGNWDCQGCRVPSRIEPSGEGYSLTCPRCGRHAWGSHKTFVEMTSRPLAGAPLILANIP